MGTTESSLLLKTTIFRHIDAFDATLLHISLGTLLRLIDNHIGVPITF